MRFFVLCLVLFIILMIIIYQFKSKLLENFEDTMSPLSDAGGVEADPTMTFKSNTMKGTDKKPVNEGKIILGYKGPSGFVFKSDEVMKSYPLAVQGQLVDNEAMGVIMWQAMTKMYEQVGAQEGIINELTEKIKAIEGRLAQVEPLLVEEELVEDFTNK